MTTVANFTPIVNHGRNIPWHRSVQTEHLADYREMLKSGVSERQAAASLGVPRSTLQSWRNHAETLDAEPEVVTFFEGSIGLAFLHRLVHGMHVVFVELGACGIRLVCQVLKLTGLDRFVASSYESQRRINVAVECAITHYAKSERERLAPAMPQKDITVAQDETFTGGLTLVAIEPESGFIILEDTSKTRDAAAWKTAMDRASADLKCNIIQSTSDEGTGLVAYAENLLGANHSPDLFHVQQELTRAVSPPIAAKIRAAEKAAGEALVIVRTTQSEAKEYVETIDTRGAGRPPNWAARIDEATLAAIDAQSEVDRLHSVRETVREGIKGLSTDYHLADLTTGVRCDSSIVVGKLQMRIDAVRAAAEAEGLAEHSMKRIAKAERVLPTMSATIDFVSGYLRRQVDKLGLKVAEAYAVHAKLIPACYLERVAAKGSKKEGAPLREKANGLVSPLFAPGGVFFGLDLAAQDQLKSEADRLAGVFQRSSSCVEGRNGVLSFRHHGLRGIPDRKRECLTALHNYFIQRSNCTTAAERFFGSKPRDLFHAVLASVDVPRRPKSPTQRTFANSKASN